MNNNNNTAENLWFTKHPFIEDVGPRMIKSIQFSMLSESEIMKSAEVQIWKAQYYDEQRQPIEGGLLDPRLGPVKPNGTCATCHGSFHMCPGHYGYFTLALPVFHIGYRSTILDILKCICKSCCRVLLDEKLFQEYLKKMRNPKIDALRKSDYVKNIVKKCITVGSRKCSRCGFQNGLVKKSESLLIISHEFSKLGDENTKDVLHPVRVLALFKRMVDEDCELLYLSERPEKLIVTSIAVPPTSIRPSVLKDESRSNENDITERLKQIIRANANLRQGLEGSNALKFVTGWSDLQSTVTLYINSDVRGASVSPYLEVDKALRGFVQRLKGKQGRFRGNLSGKRVNFTGRTVISPDPNLKVTEVAIPMEMARILSYPERVSQHNIERLRRNVLNGPDKYPGARNLGHPDGSMKYLVAPIRKRCASELKCGDIVYRDLVDGDIVLFNRQPSLHRMSIMSHRVRVMPWRTLRFNESVCNPYNADFDGDEMNIHVPQTEEARTEALMLMGVQNNLCTPKNGEILVASTQDFLTASFLITRKDTFYDRAAFSHMCSYMVDGMDDVDLPMPAIIKPVELWSGKQLFTVLLRPNADVRVYVNLIVKEKNYTKPKKKDERERESMCPSDGFVYFRNSELISGQLGKATLGNGNKDGIYSVLIRDYSGHAAAVCMNRLAKLSARWIGNHGFSIGIDDVEPGKRLNSEKGRKVLEGYEKCDGLIQSYNKGSLNNRPGCDAAQTLEAELTTTLNNIREATAQVCMNELHWRNSPLIMSQCGSKGSPINISQMIACVGQQSIGGSRAPDGFIDRSLPHFPKKSKTPAAKGFVANSFFSGLTPTEFFFHTMGGREGLVDTAVKTADTGYMSRRLIKGLEDLFVGYDNTVRNASGGVIQFVYGDDGMDPANMEGKDGTPLNFDRLFLKAKATCPSGEDQYLSASEMSRKIEERLLRHDMTPEGGCSSAFKKSLEDFLQKCLKRLFNTRKTLGLVEDHIENSNTLETITQKISGVTSNQLEVFLETCISRYRMKRLEAGTPIGIIGAHSIGEPGTQMTLKTFHFAGVGSMNITLGVPRIKEIIDGTKKISTPIITAALECDDKVNVARVVKGRIEKTNLGEIAKSIEVVMTSRFASIVITLDMKRIQEAELCIDAYIVKEAILQTPRIKLKQEHIMVMDVRKLKVTPRADDKTNIHFKLHSLRSLLSTITVKGIKSVVRAVVEEKKPEENGDEKEKGVKYRLVAEGTGLLAVMGTEGVDGRNTKSNHVIEVQQVLGIEAARACIISEIQSTMASHGMSIDIRHMMLLADLMTNKGDILGITRFGIKKMDKSVLVLASFENTTDHLFNASLRGKDDRIEGVSECIIMGKTMQMGTGMLKVMQRVEQSQLLKLPYGLDPIIK